jgi:hypothetical protein
LLWRDEDLDMPIPTGNQLLKPILYHVFEPDAARNHLLDALVLSYQRARRGLLVLLYFWRGISQTEHTFSEGLNDLTKVLVVIGHGANEAKLLSQQLFYR